MLSRQDQDGIALAPWLHGSGYGRHQEALPDLPDERGLLCPHVVSEPSVDAVHTIPHQALQVLLDGVVLVLCSDVDERLSQAGRCCVETVRICHPDRRVDLVDVLDGLAVKLLLGGQFVVADAPGPPGVMHQHRAHVAQGGLGLPFDNDTACLSVVLVRVPLQHVPDRAVLPILSRREACHALDLVPFHAANSHSDPDHPQLFR